MRLTLHTDYALRMLIYLAGRDRPATVADIASCYGLSRAHLLKVARDLRRFGFVRTERGRSGGVRLAGETDAINIGDVVRRLEDDLALVECLRADGGRCILSPCCRLTGIVREALDACLSVFDKYTLADLVTDRAALEVLFAGSAAPGGEHQMENVT